MVSNTGFNSPGEPDITCSTCEVAVCCSKASLSSCVRACTSSNSRTFSIAITAWSAKVSTNSICLSVNGSAVQDEQANRNSLAQEGHPEDGAIAAQSREFMQFVFRIGENIGDLNGFALQQDPRDHTAASRRKGLGLHELNVLSRVTVARRVVIRASILLAHDCGLIRLTQSCRRLDQCVEHGL